MAATIDNITGITIPSGSISNPSPYPKIPCRTADATRTKRRESFSHAESDKKIPITAEVTVSTHTLSAVKKTLPIQYPNIPADTELSRADHIFFFMTNHYTLRRAPFCLLQTPSFNE